MFDGKIQASFSTRVQRPESNLLIVYEISVTVSESSTSHERAMQSICLDTDEHKNSSGPQVSDISSLSSNLQILS